MRPLKYLTFILIAIGSLMALTNRTESKSAHPIDESRLFPIRASRSEMVRIPRVVLPSTTTTTTPAPVRHTTTTVKPPPKRSLQPRPKLLVPPVAAGGIWACIRQHESGGNYADNTGNGYYGAYQFSASTWNATMKRLGYTQYPRADLAPPAIQDEAAINLQAVAGWGQWPRTSRICGVR